MKIHTTAIKTIGDTKIIQWSGDDRFGELTINPLGKGNYEIDSEYLDIQSVMDIITHWNNGVDTKCS